MTDHKEPNGWKLEDDTEIRELMKDDGIVQMLSVTPSAGGGPPGIPSRKMSKRKVLAIKIALSTTVVLAAFVLGILFSQNIQLKDESTKLVEETATLQKETGRLGAAVDQCRNELTLCAEDVDLMQELSEYDLTPKNKYGPGYESLRELDAQMAELTETRAALQLDIEQAVTKIWRPAKKSKEFWKDLKKQLKEKRKLERKMKRLEKRQATALAEIKGALYEKKVEIKEMVKAKNDARREVAAKLGELRGADTSIQSTAPSQDPKQDLASVSP